MDSKRDVINSFRRKIQEIGADSHFTNQEIFRTLMEHGQWLIKRDIASGRIYKNTSFFRPLKCQDIVEVSPIDDCCPVKTNCRIFRTKKRVPETWIDNNGPIMNRIVSVDGSTNFTITSPKTWKSKSEDPYQKQSKEMYAFYSDGYWFFPEHNPHKATFYGFWKDDVSKYNGCADKQDCVPYLDTEFMVPDWLISEMMSKALQQMFPAKQMGEDNQIDKNTNRKN